MTSRAEPPCGRQLDQTETLAWTSGGCRVPLDSGRPSRCGLGCLTLLCRAAYNQVVSDLVDSVRALWAWRIGVIDFC